jgi:hypothetical protein
MPETYYPLPENPEYNEQIRALRDNDPARASTIFNPLIEALIGNTHYVKLGAEPLRGRHAVIAAEGWTLGPEELTGVRWYEYNLPVEGLSAEDIVFVVPGDNDAERIVQERLRSYVGTADGYITLYASVAFDAPAIDLNIFYCYTITKQEG